MPLAPWQDSHRSQRERVNDAFCRLDGQVAEQHVPDGAALILSDQRQSGIPAGTQFIDQSAFGCLPERQVVYFTNGGLVGGCF